MKKSIFSILLSLSAFVSCNLFSSKDIQPITSIVDKTENIVSRHDNNVQSSLDSKNFRYIDTISEAALDSARIKLNELIIMEIPATQEKVRKAAIDYIESLQNVINSQKQYSTLSDSTSLAEAEKIDDANFKVIEAAAKEREKYITEINAFKK